jgi:alkanesulfonate monooxygenase SsuD/methylene tetrahydromethanopterin reductase-like flavin-dependent oxidoreductase (luciferase family)
MFHGELGIHYPLHVLNDWSLPRLLEFTELASNLFRDYNFQQVWPNDNLEYRHVLVACAAIAARYPLKIGTAITVPYLRNPIDLAGGFATISELTDGREVSLGLGAGAGMILGKHVQRRKPTTFVGETIRLLKQLFAGQEVQTAEFPTLASYFHLQAESYKLRFPVQAPIRIYYGRGQTIGDRMLREVLTTCDGVIMETRWRDPAEMEESLRQVEDARTSAGVTEPLQKVLFLSTSISKDGEAARRHAKRYASHIVVSRSDAELASRGIDPASIHPIREAWAKNLGVDAAAALVPDGVAERIVIAGTPAQCLDRIAEWMEFASQQGFHQVTIGVPFGPDVGDAVRLWAADILPALR